jgi:predicted phage terminase large subunit-like protein
VASTPTDLRARIDRMPIDRVREALDGLSPRLDPAYVPHEPTPQQQAFLLIPMREALYGGAAGGGKSDALLMAALQYVHVPNYAALLLRRTFTDLSLPGALIPRSFEWLANSDAKWDDQDHRWTFPSGATLSFGYLDTKLAHLRYQSAEFQFVGFDELTQFEEHQYRYLFSRTRRPSSISDNEPLSRVPIRVRSATNPQPPGLAWVAQRFGLTRRGRDGRMVFDRPVFTTDPVTSAVRAFVPARLADNPHLDREEYLATLAELDPITRQRLEAGDWAVAEGGQIFRREWFREVLDHRPRAVRWVRYWDLAATEQVGSNDPDYTSGTLMGWPLPDHKGKFAIAHIARFRGSANRVEATIKQVAELDGKGVPIVVEREPGASGKLLEAYWRRELVGYSLRFVPKRKTKVEAAGPLASQAEGGNIVLVRGEWITSFLDEAEAFPIGAHDDTIDSTSGAFGQLTGSGSKAAYSW